VPTINIDLGWPRHRKTKRLIALAGPQAPFCLVTLWCYAGEYHKKDGALGCYTPEEIESLAGWTGKKGKFCQALLDSGYLDSGTMKLHDWEDHEGHLQVYAEKVVKMNMARLSKISSQGVRVERLQDTRQEFLQDALQEVSQEHRVEPLHEPPVQSSSEQFSSEQKSAERRSEKMLTSSTASPSTPAASALRAVEESERAQHAAPLRENDTAAAETCAPRERTSGGNEARAEGQIRYEVRMEMLTTYLMDHCKIGRNGNRTPGVVAKFREQAGRFEKLLRDRSKQLGSLTDRELVAAAKVAFAKAGSLDRIGAFVTVLCKAGESAQVMEIAQTARKIVSRER